MSATTIALDAGHGGSDSGAVYKNRKEKDDVLRLTRAVGQILENSGVNVYYVRTDDEYETPFKKATDANNAGADYFVSIHRNSSERPNQYSGVQTLVYKDEGIKAIMARNINQELENVGFKNLGVDERPNLVVLKRTQMPALLVEVGFINNDEDNRIFDEHFDEIAQGIADGILKTLYSQDINFNEVPDFNEEEDRDERDDYENENENNMRRNPASRPGMYPPERMERPERMDRNFSERIDRDSPESMNRNLPERTNMDRSLQPMPYHTGNEIDEDVSEKLYRVQVGAFRDKSNAERMLNALLMEGFPAFMISEDGYYKVQVGAFRYLFNAIKMERRLRRFRYNTYIVYN